MAGRRKPLPRADDPREEEDRRIPSRTEAGILAAPSREEEGRALRITGSPGRRRGFSV